MTACRLPFLPAILVLTALLPVTPLTVSGQSIPGVYEPAPDDLQYPFYHGVASGDATADAVVLWTRLSFVDEELPFVAFGTVEVATDTAFTDIVASEPVQTQQGRDWCIKADVGGLEADSWYYYRFRVNVNTVDGQEERTSLTGRTKTLPAAGTLPACGRWRTAAVPLAGMQEGHHGQRTSGQHETLAGASPPPQHRHPRHRCEPQWGGEGEPAGCVEKESGDDPRGECGIARHEVVEATVAGAAAP